MASRSLCTWPATALTSRYAAVPSPTPTSRSPIAVSSTTEPRTTSRRRTSPFADFATVVPRARSTTIAPLAALTLRSPPATPIHVSPLEFFTTALASSSRRRTSPDAVVISTLRVARSTVMSPRAALHAERADAVEADVADAGADPDVSERAVAGEVRGPAAPWRPEPVGTSSVTSMDAAAAAAQPRAQLRALHDEMAVGVVHARELGGLAVLLVGRVARAHARRRRRCGRRRRAARRPWRGRCGPRRAWGCRTWASAHPSLVGLTDAAAARAGPGARRRRCASAAAATRTSQALTESRSAARPARCRS